jgi:hypothetical protein
MVKKYVILLICILAFAGFVAAVGEKIEITPTKDIFQAGDAIMFEVNVYDSLNKLMDVRINIEIEDSVKKDKIERMINSNEIVNVELPEDALSGVWTITAVYGDVIGKENFVVQASSEADFNLNGDVLTITNTGNIRYTETVQVLIGETVEIKQPKLDIGGPITYRLIAPEGVYDISVVVNDKTVLTKSGVSLAGNVVGVLDERISDSGASLTGGVKPGNESGDPELAYSFLKKNKFVYVFVLAIFGAMILLVIERRFVKRTEIDSKN